MILSLWSITCRKSLYTSINVIIYLDIRPLITWGSSHDKVILMLLVGWPSRFIGNPGTLASISVVTCNISLGALVPREFCATTWNWYVIPGCKPRIMASSFCSELATLSLCEYMRIILYSHTGVSEYLGYCS